jgi:hypothetical protein
MATGGFLGSTVLEVGSDLFNVDDASTARPLVGLREAKDYLNIERDDDAEDEELRAAILTASALVEAETRVWRRGTFTETLQPARVICLGNLPVVSLVSITQEGTDVIDPAQYSVPASGIVEAKYLAPNPWGWWPNTNDLVFTYVAGETVIPLPVRQAVLVTVEHLWNEQRGPAALPLQSGEPEEFTPSIQYALPAAAEKLLEPWRKVPAIA